MKNNFFKLIIVIILIILLSFFILVVLSHKVMPYYINYAREEIKMVVTSVINKSVTEELTNQFDTNSLFIVKSNEKTTIVDFDPVIVNKVMSSVANLVYDNLKLISQKDKDFMQKYNISNSIFYIPSGVIFNTVMLNNLGPKIPIKLEFISSVNPNIKTEVSEYGINNSLIEVYIQVVTSVRMILPMHSNNMEITVLVPVAVKLIQGEVPEYYQHGIDSYLSGLYFNNQKRS